MTSRARSGLVLLAVFACAMVSAAPAGAQEASAPQAGAPQVVVPPDAQRNPPAVNPSQAVRIADRTREVRDERSRHPDLHPIGLVLYRGSGNWDITYASGDEKLADITISGRTGRVVEAWQGIQAGWIMARGHDGYFGKRFESWYVWLPLCLLFIAPFFDPRRPFRMLHLDLLIL